jgi:hypothetical protein
LIKPFSEFIVKTNDMKKLEDIPKKDFFSAPEGYFETLPGKVMTRLEKKREAEHTPVLRYALQFAVPLIVIIVVGVFWFRQEPSTENMLASVETEELVDYLADADTGFDPDFIDNLDFSVEEATAVEEEVFDLQWTGELPDDILNELDSNNL